MKDSETGFSRSYVVSLDKARAVPRAWKIILVIQSRLAQGSIPGVHSFPAEGLGKSFQESKQSRRRGPSLHMEIIEGFYMRPRRTPYSRTHEGWTKPKNSCNYDFKPKLSPQVFHSLGKVEESSGLEVFDLKQTERMTLLLRKG